MNKTTDKQQKFCISNNFEGVSSSIYQFGEYRGGEKSLWPELELKMIDSITLPMMKLDTLLEGNKVDPNEYDYWIVDLQGAELITFKGAKNSLRSCKAIYVEVSTVEVYEGGAKWEEIKDFLGNIGFSPLWTPSMDDDDILFVRDDHDLPIKRFHTIQYLRHNQRRQEHLSSLNLDLQNKNVLEVGAGIGDHSNYFLDRGCRLLTTEVRPEKLEIIKQRFQDNKKVRTRQLDMDNPVDLNETFDCVYCYGLLYHLNNPENALIFLTGHCSGVLLLETCVSSKNNVGENIINESSGDMSQAFYGKGCRPSRKWVWDKLNELMPYVYCTVTQPAHEEFPLDWSSTKTKLTRAVFIASRHKIVNPNLVMELPKTHLMCN